MIEVDDRTNQTSVQCTLQVLSDRIRGWQEAGLRVALCHGCFDVLHVGHIEHFQQAATFADRLVVTVTPDRFVNKGPGRPVFSQAERATVIAAIRWVEGVAINEWPDAVPTLDKLRPDVFVKGIDYADATSSPGFSAEQHAAHQLGVAVQLTSSHKVSFRDRFQL